ncbi:SusE domain-containing protein [Polaribacter sp. IC073]|uniref:SusE domain-containing protein n=1 Tax=Polaribacter sp. IC073 TaxID=2508540 RepID=UPI0011BF7C31|nr:SusE domain-containing protein [Polaribacter sp. IC073]TXD47201.1 SusF/SusE family outer membrane protein [Polaribacter sp. IC073]
MKIYLKRVSFLFLSLILLFGACDTEESLTITSPDPEFKLIAPGISNVFLNFALPDNPAFTITWIDEINASATYAVEMSVEDTFAAPIQLGNTDKKNFTMTVGELNQKLDNASVKSYSATAIYVRLNTGSSISNVVLFQVSKFAVKPPVITSPDTSFSQVLSDVNPDDTALTISWNDPEIGATSSVSITYEVEMAVEGTDFASPTNIGTATTTTFEISHDNLNDLVIASGAKATIASNLDFRIKAIAKSASGDLTRTSDPITISLTAFKAAIPDNLFMVGAHNGWNNADATQQFFNDGNGVFAKVQAFTAGEEFKMIPTSGAWDGDYGEDKNNPGKIVQDDEQNIKIATTGNYVVIVDFNTLSFKLQNIDTMFMVGAHNGWNNADETQQFFTSGNGVFIKVQTFTQGEEFKILPNSGSWDGDWGENKTTPNRLEQDDEQNIKIDATGTFMVSLDFNTLSFNLTEVPTDLHLVGSPNGWDNTTAPAFTKISEGLFELTLTLTASDEFKFLPVQGSWDNDWGESKVYSRMLTRDNENNVKSPGDGTYKITVDYNKGTITIQ